MIKLNENSIGKFNLINTLFVLFIFAVVVILFSINSKQKDFETLKPKIKERFIQEKKREIKFKVDTINQLVIEKQKRNNLEIKNLVKSRVENSYKIAYKIYDENKNRKTKQEIIELIKETLRSMKFDNGLGYVFISSLDGIQILFPPYPDLEGTNILNTQDKKGNFVVKEEIKIVQDKGEGYLRGFWNKPDNKKMVYEKLTYVKEFKELGFYIGTGIYIKDILEKNQKEIKNALTELNKKGSTEYIMVAKILNINGGDKFAKIIVHPSATLGTVIGDEKKDLYGKDYRKEYLKGLRKNGQTYLNYSYIHPKTKKEMYKISYFVLNKEWNWIIGTGFHDNIIDKEISSWQNDLNYFIKQNIYLYVAVLLFFVFVMFLLILFINKLTNKIIEQYKSDVQEKEEQLNKANKTLQVKVEKEVAKSLKQQKVIQEQSKMAEIGDMMGNIAHQWRQPLSVISTAATGIILKKECSLDDKEYELELLNTINNSAQHLSKTIEDFRDFIKGNESKTNFKINEVIEKTLIIEKAVLKSNYIDVIKDFDTEVIVNNLENALIQSLVNIINNSKDAFLSNDNDRFIFLSTKKTKQEIEISIKDTAGGIPENIIGRIFEPYFTTKHKSQGTGLGLNMTYVLITENMQGTILVENQEFEYNEKIYKGVVFKIILPI